MGCIGRRKRGKVERDTRGVVSSTGPGGIGRRNVGEDWQGRTA
jgi:hypothetical protein